MEGMTPEEENVLLKAEIAALREQVLMLTVQVQDLQARLAKDSHNIGLGEGIFAGTYKGF
jgi:hypothetical protein